MYNVNVALEERDETTSTVKICLYGLAPIQIGQKVKYQRVRLNAGVIPTRSWDATISRPTQSYSKQDGGSLHRSIDFMCLTLQRAYMESPHKTAQAVRTKYDELMGKGKVVQQKSTMLLDIVRAWETRDDRSAHTIHTYTVFGRKVAEFERRQRTKIDLSKATTEELEDFLHWIQSTDGLGNNTMATQQKFVNMALNEMRDAGLSAAKCLKSYSFKTPTKAVLEWSELKQVIDHVPRSPTDALAQTICVGLCLGGVRISDTYLMFNSISKRGNVLSAEFVQTKNSMRHPVTVGPVIWEPLRLLLERNGPVDRISEKHIRVSTKKLLKAVGVGKDLQVHSFRRSFVGLFLSIGISDWLIAKVNTGHVMSASGSGRGMLHSYNHSGLMVARRSLVEAVRKVPLKQTCGIQLLSDDVCPD